MQRFILIIACLLGYLSVNAQIQFDSFQDLLKYADTHAFSIKSAEMGEQIAISEKKEAGTNLLPTINGSLGYNDNITLQPTLVPSQFLNPSAPEGEFQELTFGTKYQYTRGIQAQWDVLNFQKLFAFKTAKIGEETSRLSTEITRYNTYNQLASTYYSILLTQESIQIYEANAEVAASILKSAQEKYQKGIISEAELNRAEIKQIQTQSNLNLAKNNLSQFYVQLQSQLNTSQPITITDTPDKFVLVNTSIQAIHPEVRLQEVEVERYESLVKQTKAMRLPSISLVYQRFNTWATDEFMGFSDANELPQQTFGLSINLSNMLGFSTRQKIKQSKWQLQLQQQQLENTKLLKQKEDDLLQLQLEQTSDQLSETKKILALQAENDVHAENNYQGGIMSLDNRLDIYDDLLASQDSYLQSLAAYTLAQYKIYIRQIDFQHN